MQWVYTACTYLTHSAEVLGQFHNKQLIFIQTVSLLLLCSLVWFLRFFLFSKTNNCEDGAICSVHTFCKPLWKCSDMLRNQHSASASVHLHAKEVRLHHELPLKARVEVCFNIRWEDVHRFSTGPQPDYHAYGGRVAVSWEEKHPSPPERLISPCQQILVCSCCLSVAEPHNESHRNIVVSDKSISTATLCMTIELLWRDVKKYWTKCRLPWSWLSGFWPAQPWSENTASSWLVWDPVLGQTTQIWEDVRWHRWKKKKKLCKW